MKKIWILSLLWICLLFTGCFNNRQALPENPIIFSETEIDWHWAIENDWKYYLVYSTIMPKWVIWDFNYAFWECLWYVGDDKNDRIYELNGESADEWLIKYYVNGEMEMPMILREISMNNEIYIPESVEEPEEDIPEWWWERITIVTDMCEEEWWELDYWNWAEICVFWEDNRCYFDDLAYWNCRNGNIPEEDWTILIPADWITYRNDEYWFQIKFWKERSGGKIYDSFRKYNIYNYNTDYDGWIKNPFIVFTVPSPRRTWKFENIADIIVYTYEEYEQARQNQMDPECLMCSLEEFDKAIVWKNNKYYFLLGRSNRSDDELKTIFPSLECREEIDDNIYSHNYWGSYIYCDWLEYINWEPKKTWKDWVEQLFPAESFEFFDVKGNAENNEFLEDIKSNWAQPQRINDYTEETENLNVLDITDKTMDTEYLINLTIWDKNFDVILENNSATRALYEKLKEWNVVINAKEYWWFEKVWNLGFSLPREDKQITTQLWDLVLYNWNQVSLFYNSNSWSYTKLWTVQNITESDFWDWDITLTFSLKK